ncbi:transposase family protein [Streptomyces sp. WAC 06725]|uniref:transposase family protein n=1 Tax=Streptomyces sp. WAC 06725 TaxID=2203209 RepID=UPI0021ADA066|nr:transposase family protein [Streptomyces sp. WAC 06725]
MDLARRVPPSTPVFPFRHPALHKIFTDEARRYLNTGLIVPHRKRQGRPLLPGEEEDNAEHRKVRARVEHAFARMKHYKILRDCRQRGDGLHHAVQAVAHMHNLALAT